MWWDFLSLFIFCYFYSLPQPTQIMTLFVRCNFQWLTKKRKSGKVSGKKNLFSLLLFMLCHFLLLFAFSSSSSSFLSISLSHNKEEEGRKKFRKRGAKEEEKLNLSTILLLCTSCFVLKKSFLGSKYSAFWSVRKNS